MLLFLQIFLIDSIIILSFVLIDYNSFEFMCA